MFTWLFALLAALGALSWTPAAHACKCAPPDAPKSAKNSAEAVFEGEVVAIEEDASDLLVSLRVPRAWKGIDAAEQIRVRTRKDTAACGYPFVMRGRYLVYAQAAAPAQADASLVVQRCSRTRTLAEAEQDLLELGMGSTPVALHAPGEDLDPPKTESTAVERRRDQPASGGCASCSLSARRDLPLSASLLIAALSLRLLARNAARQRTQR